MKEKTLRNTLKSLATLGFALAACATVLLSPLQEEYAVTTGNMAVILAGTILGGIHGAGAAGLYIILCSLGLPAFPGKNSGLEYLTGPWGGFIWGYFLSALFCGLILGTPHTFEKKFNGRMWLKIAAAALASYAIIHIPGILWFRHSVLQDQQNPFYRLLALPDKKESLKQLFLLTVSPHAFKDLIKFILTVPLAAILRPVAARYLWSSPEKEEEELIEAIKNKKARLDALGLKDAKISRKQKSQKNQQKNQQTSRHNNQQKKKPENPPGKPETKS